MTKVLVLGSTGFIGFAVASALARAGHEVTGQTRNAAANGERLQQHESEFLGVRRSFSALFDVTFGLSLQSSL